MNAMMMFSKVLRDTYSNEIERQASVVAWKCVPGVRAAWYAPRGRESHLDHQLIGKALLHSGLAELDNVSQQARTAVLHSLLPPVVQVQVEVQGFRGIGPVCSQW